MTENNETEIGSARAEVVSGKRFAFGKNWSRFLSLVNDERIQDAVASLRSMLEVTSLQGKRFLDAGSGSGLFSLAARNLGATVHSFDFDAQSVRCAQELRDRYFSNDARWSVELGSVLDAKYVRSRGEFDVVYCWGVLHHTGDMWRALENIGRAVAPGGKLFIALYNDQGPVTGMWRLVKRMYCSNYLARAVICGSFIPYFVARGFVGDLLLRRRNPLERYLRPQTRGMSLFYDWFDWLGGLPFEVAKPEEVVRFCRDRGFTLDLLVTAGGGSANNEFVFTRTGSGALRPFRTQANPEANHGFDTATT